MVLQDGILVKTGATTRRYVGTIRTDSTTTTIDDMGALETKIGGRRFVFNQDNRVPLAIFARDKTSSWSYGTGTWRIVDGATAPTNCVEYVSGDPTTEVTGLNFGAVQLASNSARVALVGIGVDSSNPTPFCIMPCGYNTSAASAQISPLTAFAKARPGIGYHYVAPLEFGADGTSTWAGTSLGTQVGLEVEILG